MLEGPAVRHLGLCQPLPPPLPLLFGRLQRLLPRLCRLSLQRHRRCCSVYLSPRHLSCRMAVSTQGCTARRLHIGDFAPSERRSLPQLRHQGISDTLGGYQTKWRGFKMPKARLQAIWGAHLCTVMRVVELHKAEATQQVRIAEFSVVVYELLPSSNGLCTHDTTPIAASRSCLSFFRRCNGPGSDHN